MADPTSGGAKRPTGPIEATFSTLTLSLGTQAVIAMGFVENPASGKVETQLDEARFNIDMLRMLRDKTQGNLIDSEQKLLNDILADLQMKFVLKSKTP